MLKFYFTTLFSLSSFFLSFWTPLGYAGHITGYSSKSLSLKDYSQMRNLIQNRIKESKESLSKENPTVGVDEAVEHLKESLMLVLMRPDRDHKSPPLVLMLQNEIMNYRSFETVFREIVEEAILEFKSSAGSPERQAGMLYVLENSMAYLKSINKPESSKALKKIAAGNLKISNKMKNYLILEMGREEPLSPSYTAKLILKKRRSVKKAEALRKKAFEKKQKKKSTEKLTTVKETKPLRESASQADLKPEESFTASIKNWFFPQTAEPREDSDEAENKNQKNSLEIIKIDL